MNFCIATKPLCENTRSHFDRLDPISYQNLGLHAQVSHYGPKNNNGEISN